jgi:hypothetical protein
MQRMIFTQGPGSFLMYGDPDCEDDRFWMMVNGVRTGRALPVLLAEGWSIVSVTELAASPRDSLIVLERLN